MAVIAYLECDECDNIAMSFDAERVIEKAERHQEENPDHQLYLHTFESDSSRKL